MPTGRMTIIRMITTMSIKTMTMLIEPTTIIITTTTTTTTVVGIITTTITTIMAADGIIANAYDNEFHEMVPWSTVESVVL
jgi:hypothetical protein